MTRTLRNTRVCLGVNLLGSTPLTKRSQNAFQSKDKYRTEGICVEKNPTTDYQTLKEKADCQSLAVK
jgi:hypothetical protein